MNLKQYLGFFFHTLVKSTFIQSTPLKELTRDKPLFHVIYNQIKKKENQKKEKENQLLKVERNNGRDLS